MTTREEEDSSRLRIAIVGGGFAGCCAAAALSAAFAASSGQEPPPEITLLDMGGRGVGGRSSHRRVRASDSAVLPDDAPPDGAAPLLEFDHGAQFFRAQSAAMRRLAKHWVDRGWAAEWRGRFARVSCSDGEATGEGDPSGSSSGDFFGCPPPRGSGEPLFVGVGGMQTICRRVLSEDAPGVIVRRGVRVSRVEWCGGSSSGGAGGDGGGRGRWRLHGTSGRAALHDTPESELSSLEGGGKAEQLHGDDDCWDMVLMTDVSSSFGEWHRASAGLTRGLHCPAAPIAERVGRRPRVPLFTAMVAFRRGGSINGGGSSSSGEGSGGAGGREPPADRPLDAFTVSDSEVLWFAACNSSKPAFPKAFSKAPPKEAAIGGGRAAHDEEEELYECWTLVSTAAFAVAEIGHTTMQDPETGAFLAQDPEYLNGPGGPSRQLLSEFRRAIGTALRSGVSAPVAADAPPVTVIRGGGGDGGGSVSIPGYGDEDVFYLQGQRWGSALPQPTERINSQNGGDGGSGQGGSNGVCRSTVRVMDVEYDPSPGGFIPPLAGTAGGVADGGGSPYWAGEAPATAGAGAGGGGGEASHSEFMEDTNLGFFYAGDFCSYLPGRNPGIEAATLSGIAAAQQMATLARMSSPRQEGK